MLKKFVPAGLVTALVLLLPNLAMAQEGAKSGGGAGWGHLSAAIVLGIAAAAGAMSQGKAAVAACDGMARNPGAAAKIQTMAIIGLVLIESLVIYALVIAFQIKSS